MDLLGRLLGHYRYAAIALVTLLTLGIVGAVVLTERNVGNVSNTQSPKPVAKGGYAPPPQQQPQPPAPPPDNSGASNYPPYNPGASSYPPYDNGASSYPPYNPGASAGNPTAFPASSAPPVPNAGSGGPPGRLLSCRLPVYAAGPGSGGFIVFPGQTFVADPRSGVTVPSPSPGAPASPPPAYGPGYAGFYGMTYDAGYSKWLPVPYAWVSPDGAHYAFASAGDTYAVTVASGALAELDSGRNFAVIDVENNGVYAEQQNQAGLWFLPFSGTPTQVATTHYWQGVSGGFAYGTPTSQVPVGASNSIDRLDLRTAAITSFFDQAGGVSRVTGFDLQAHPIIQVDYPQGQAIFIVTSASTSIVIAASGYGYGFTMPGGTPIADSHGIWYSTGNGVVLYSNGQWYYMASIGGQLAGQCL